MGSTISQLMIKLGMDSSGVDAGVGKAKQSLGGLSESMKSVVSTAGGFLLANVIGSVAGGVARLASAGLDFGKQMANVNSIILGSDAQIKQLSDAVITLAGDPRITQGPAELAAGLYSIVSAGFSASDSMNILKESAMAASAGLTSTEISSKAMVSVLDAYHLSADNAGAISNTLFQIVNAGVLTFEQLAGTIGTVLPMASALGVGLDELGAAYVTLTRQGVSADESTTQLSSIMTGLLKPSQSLTDALIAHGYASGEALLKDKGFAGALVVLKDIIGGSSAKAADMFGNVRALRGILGLTTNDGKDYAAAFDSMGHAQDGVGATAKALAKQMQSASYQIGLAKKEMLIAATIAVGSLSPAIVVLAKVAVFLIQAALIPLINLIGKVLNPIFGLMGSAVNKVRSIFDGLISGTFAKFTPKLKGLELGAQHFTNKLKGLELGAHHLAKGLDGLHDAGGRLINGFTKLEAVVMMISMLFTKLTGIDASKFFTRLGESLNTAVAAFQYFTSHGINPFEAAVQALEGFLADMGLNGIARVVTDLQGFIQAIGIAFDGTTSFKDLLTRVPDSLKPITLGLIDIVSGLGKLYRAFQDGGIKGILAAWPDISRQLGNGFRIFGDALVGAIASVAGSLYDAFVGLPWGDIASAGWAVLSGAVMALATAGIDIVSAAVNVGEWLIGSIPDIWNWFTSHVFGAVPEGDGTSMQMTNGFTLKDVAVNVANWAVGTIADLSHFLWDSVKGASVALSSTLVSVGNWAAGTIAPLSSWLLDQVKGASVALSSTAVTVLNWAVGTAWPELSGIGGWIWDQVKGASVSLASTAVTILNWAVGTAWPALGGVGGWIWDQVKGASVSLASTMVTVLNWASSLDWPDVGTWIYDQIKGAVVNLGTWTLSVGAPLVSIGAGVVAAAVWTAISPLTVVAFSWTLNIGAPTVAFDVGFSLGTLAQQITNLLVDTKVAGFDTWELVLGSPFITMGAVFLIALSPAIAAYLAVQMGPVGLLKWTLNIAALPVLGYTAAVPIGSEIQAFIDLLTITTSLATWALNLSPPGFPNLTAENLVKWIGDKIAGMGTITVDLTKIALNIVGLGGVTSSKDSGSDYGLGNVPASPLYGGGKDLSGGNNTKLGMGAAASLGDGGFSFPAMDFTTFNKSISDAATFVTTTLNGIATTIGGWVSNVGALATGAGNLFNANLSAGLGEAVASANLFETAIANATGAWTANMGAFGTSAGSQFNDNLSQGMGTAVSSAKLFTDAIATNTGDFASNLGALGQSAGDSFLSGLQDGLGQALTSAYNVGQQIQSSLDIGDQWSVGYSIGDSLGSGINAGIGNWTSAIAATASAAVSGAIAAAKTAGGIASPSKEMMWIGDMLGQGLHIAMSRWIAPVADAGRALVSAAIPNAMTPSYAGGGSGGSVAGPTFNGGITINVTGNGDPKATADAVFAVFSRELGLRTGV